MREVEVGRERMTVVTSVAIEDVDCVDLVEELFLGVCAENIGDAGIEAGAQERHDSGGFESLPVGPLPLVFELRFVGRLVVCGVEVVDSGFEAGIHQRQVLVGQSDVDQEVGLLVFDQCDALCDVIGIDLGDLDFATAKLSDLLLDLLASRQGPTRQSDL
jgi:hypothetical protein